MFGLIKFPELQWVYGLIAQQGVQAQMVFQVPVDHL